MRERWGEMIAQSSDKVAKLWTLRNLCFALYYHHPVFEYDSLQICEVHKGTTGKKSAPIYY